MDERLKFLQEKLTSEEIEEVKKRYGGKAPSSSTGSSAKIVNSEKAAGRLETVNSHFSFMTAINIGSLAVCTSLGINLLLESIKEKKDLAMREEVKDRIDGTLKESQERIRALEQALTNVSSTICQSDEVEEIVAKRFEQYENT